MKIYRLYVKKKNDVTAQSLAHEIMHTLGVSVEIERYIRYDIQGMSEDDLNKTKNIVFSEPPIDTVSECLDKKKGFEYFAVEYLPGQYDQRADSAMQCVQLVTAKERPKIRCATVYGVKGATDSQLVKIQNFIINPVESRLASLDIPKTLDLEIQKPQKVQVIEKFTEYSTSQIADFHKQNGLAMTTQDLEFVQSYFQKEKRQPTITEIKVIDTYWSDHCRHTTFSTEIKNIEIKSDNPVIKDALNLYDNLFLEINGQKNDKYKCLMDIATIGAKQLKKQGLLDDLDLSDEINACSINVTINEDGKDEEYLIMFKNETHNHPTEIEPFGGAATCLGGAIRDPLSGRTYVYQAMRVSGSADPTTPFEKTVKGKLPQRVITTTAARGFSSYGNQIGLATGIVAEMYHENYVAKRLETGFVVGANKKENVYRQKPRSGDVVILLGGETGRDGCGGATGSSKAHTKESIEVCGAEVQKGNALTERKIQRLFRNPKVSSLVKKCNDFGAGGVCVAIGELSDGIDIDLSKVPKKYDGLDGTELAISESQERMAVVIDKKNQDKFIELCDSENLPACVVAIITDTARMRMMFEGDVIVDISREFLDTNGVRLSVDCIIDEDTTDYISSVNDEISEMLKKGQYERAMIKTMSNLNVCSKKGLGEMFDSTIGGASVYMPYGGKTQLTPSIAMAAIIPTEKRATDMATVSSWACNPYLMSQSPFVGSQHSIAASVSKLVACGVDYKKIRLTLQEYFQRLNMDKVRFGQPLSAMLGALYSQIGLGIGAIGGKDSMSGTFENIDVPPTLISFALGIEDSKKLITNVLTQSRTKLYRLPIKRDEFSNIDFSYAKKLYGKVYDFTQKGDIKFATVIEHGGAFAATASSCLGNTLGFNFNDNADIFSNGYGDILVDVSEEKLKNSGLDYDYIGETTADAYFYSFGCKVSLKAIREAFEGKLEDVFKTHAENTAPVWNGTYDSGIRKSGSVKIAKPTVFIPVFPGTNCEYDTAEKFIKAGAKVEVMVVKNRSQSQIEDSISHMAKLIKNSQIIAFPGGFSGGDEPDGSGKFIVAAFRNPKLSELLNEHINVKDGLILGICNGFQAIIKLGLLQHSAVKSQDDTSCTLTYNNIARHVSTIVNIKVSSNLSPWLNGVNVGDVYSVAVSHGEGKFIAPSHVLKALCDNGQIATQYVDELNNPTNLAPYNPNGSYYAIEGITSPCGRVYGKMGHSERIGKNLYKNYFGNFDMKLFESGVNYFK